MKIFRFALWCAFSLSVLCATIMQTIATLGLMNHYSNYFEAGSSLPAAAIITAMIAAVIGTIAAWVTPPADPKATPFSGKLRLTPAPFGFLLSAFAVM